MSDALLGALIGGSITVLPIIVSAVLSFIQSNRQRQHELDLRVFDDLVMPLHAALLEYSDCLFVLLDRFSTSKDAEDKYKAAFGKASILAGEVLRSKMNEVHLQVLTLLASGTSVRQHKALALFSDPAYTGLQNAIHASLKELENIRPVKKHKRKQPKT